MSTPDGGTRDSSCGGSPRTTPVRSIERCSTPCSWRVCPKRQGSSRVRVLPRSGCQHRLRAPLRAPLHASGDWAAHSVRRPWCFWGCIHLRATYTSFSYGRRDPPQASAQQLGSWQKHQWQSGIKDQQQPALLIWKRKGRRCSSSKRSSSSSSSTGPQVSPVLVGRGAPVRPYWPCYGAFAAVATSGMSSGAQPWKQSAAAAAAAAALVAASATVIQSMPSTLEGPAWQQRRPRQSRQQQRQTLP